MTSSNANPSNHDSSLDRGPTPAEQAALAWVVRCERGLSPEQEREFAHWLGTDLVHRELFNEFGGTWRMLGQLAETAKPAGVAAFAATAAEARTLPFESAGAKRRATPRGVRMIWMPLAAAAAIALGYVSLSRSAANATSVATEVGGSRQLKLPDGSLVRLNTDSAVVTVFTPTERRVRLTKGEAFFEVAKNPARPFIVEAAGVGVRAVGTAFNVRMRTESVDVLVTEGKVRVAPELAVAAAAAKSSEPVTPIASSTLTPSAPPPATEVAAGERLVVSVAPTAAQVSTAPLAVVPVAADEVSRLLAWQDRRLSFSDTALGEMVAEFNRYNRHQLIIADAELAAQRFGGSFRPDDRAGFVRMLRENFGVRAEERENQTVLHAAH